MLVQGQALFGHQGELAFVRNHVHLHGEYLAGFAAAGLSVQSCAEAPMTPDFSDSPFLGPVAEAATALWAGLPVALVWTLERQ